MNAPYSEGGVELAERYYREVHNVKARFERDASQSGEYGEPQNEYVAS